jgi:hypothetical protein
MSITEFEDDDDESFLILDSLDSAFIGVAHVFNTNGTIRPRAVYSGPLIVEALMRDGLTHDEAHEYISFNIEGLYAGERTFIVYHPYDLKEGGGFDIHRDCPEYD